MRASNTFPIESGLSRYKLTLNGQKISTFDTFQAADAEAGRIARRMVLGATLRFKLDFKWTLSCLEIRAATLDAGNKTQQRICRDEVLLCGS